MKLTRPLCLASASPRRRELLERFGLEFVQIAPSADESALPGEPPAEHLLRVAGLKAEAARAGHLEHLVLAGDTAVFLDGEMLGKPGEAEAARRMLSALSGRTHTVLTAYVILDARDGERCSGAVETRVTFRRLPPEWIQWYSRLDEPLDKAGAYGIQGIGGAMVERIDGSYTNVVGFPIENIIWDMIGKGWLTL
ncbi:MAG: septum formation protein Maf [SAR324 cluster bacterium]|nr:septum formation protein Maf [SAR324 cluster bacterium]MCH8887991.1 septum formation protein Maf [SAR324 cluster bacterium]